MKNAPPGLTQVSSVLGQHSPICPSRDTDCRLGSGAALPPLVLSEEEAAATVLGLMDVTTGTHAVPADAAISAMAKIVQVLPAGIRRRVSGLSSVAGPLERNRATIPDVTVLTTIALAARDTDTLEFAYQGIRSNQASGPLSPTTS